MVKLYSAQIPRISQTIIRALIDQDLADIEPARVVEAERDVASVMQEYLRMDRRIMDQAKDLVSARRQGRESLGRIRRQLAKEAGHHLGDDGFRWMHHQIIEVLLASPNVEEIYADDSQLLRQLRAVFEKLLVSEDSLDAEVRARMKNVQEGTATWDIQYQKTMTEVRRKHGLIRDRDNRGRR